MLEKDRESIENITKTLNAYGNKLQEMIKRLDHFPLLTEIILSNEGSQFHLAAFNDMKWLLKFIEDQSKVLRDAQKECGFDAGVRATLEILEENGFEETLTPFKEVADLIKD